MNMLNIALSKGRLADKALELFSKAGYQSEAALDISRRLIIEEKELGFRFIFAKPADVPTYVDYGVADIGIVGKDTLLEEGRNLYELLDLGFGYCRMCVCGPKEKEKDWQYIQNKRIGTKYPNIAREHFEIKGRETVEVIKINGSVELAPLLSLADIIVDVVESGRTLKENGLTDYETIAEISARMVVNRVSMKMKAKQIKPLIDAVRAVLTEK